MMIQISIALPRQHFQILTDFAAVVERATELGFESFSGYDSLDDGDAVELDSRMWAQRFLRPDASPYQEGTEVRRYIHHATTETDDLIWHGFVVDNSIEVTVIESAESYLIRLKPTQGTVLGRHDTESESLVEGLAESVVALTGTYDDAFGQQVSYRWTFVYDPPMREGSLFTSGPDSDPFVLTSWTERLDGGIKDDVLYFHGYKVHGAGDGRNVSLSGKHWFDGKCWEPYDR